MEFTWQRDAQRRHLGHLRCIHGHQPLCPHRLVPRCRPLPYPALWFQRRRRRPDCRHSFRCRRTHYNRPYHLCPVCPRLTQHRAHRYRKRATSRRCHHHFRRRQQSSRLCLTFQSRRLECHHNHHPCPHCHHQWSHHTERVSHPSRPHSYRGQPVKNSCSFSSMLT